METAPPAGYDMPSSTTTNVTLNAASVTTKVANNKTPDPTGTVSLIKHDSGDESTVLQGAVFTLKSSDNSDIQTGLITGTDGKVSVPNLPYGSYKWVETAAPEGYVFPPVTPEMDIILNSASSEIKMPNDKLTGSLTIRVYETGASTDLPGASFSLHKGNSEGSYDQIGSDLITSTGGVTVPNLEYGTYRFIQDVAPANHIIPASPITEVVLNSASKTVIVYNDPGSTVVITAVDQDATSITLPGAVVTIEIHEGDNWTPYQERLTTDSSGKITVRRIPYGEYRIVENTPPTGYLLGNPSNYTVTVDSYNTAQTITFKKNS